MQHKPFSVCTYRVDAFVDARYRSFLRSSDQHDDFHQMAIELAETREALAYLTEAIEEFRIESASDDDQDFLVETLKEVEGYTP